MEDGRALTGETVGFGTERLSRRVVLQGLAAGGGSIGLAGLLAACGGSIRLSSIASPTTKSANAVAPNGSGGIVTESRGAIRSVTLTASFGAKMGRTTRKAWGYNGTSPGPTLLVHPGDVLRVKLVNSLDEPTNLHVHGLHVSPSGNGDNPFLNITSGTSYDYEFQIPDNHPLGTYWYHPHRMGLTADQVWEGMFGALIVAGTGEPEVDADKVLILSDITLDGTGAVVSPSEAERLVGRVGHTLLVNGQARPHLTARPGEVQRWRLINATASRILTLNLDGLPLSQIAIDGKYLTAAQPKSAVTLAPGNRVDVIVRPDTPGTFVLTAHTAVMGSGNTIGMQAKTDTAATLTVAGAPVTARPAVTLPAAPVDNAGPTTRTRQIVLGINPSAVPATPGASDAAIGLTGSGSAPDSGAARMVSMPGMGSTRSVMSTDSENSMNGLFTINGRMYDASRNDEVAQFGTVEEWTVVNHSWMAHPFHMHTWPFTVLDGAEIYGVPQDVVIVPARGSVRLRIPFTGVNGRTVFHCHILDHGDDGMMATILVT
jgi:FtsP/CotA-like multicopper oxidase with cupredoxin domain